MITYNGVGGLRQGAARAHIGASRECREYLHVWPLSLSLSLSQGTERICRSFIFRTIFYTTTTTAGRSVFPFKRVADVPSHSLKLIEIKARALDVVDMAQINPPFRYDLGNKFALSSE